MKNLEILRTKSTAEITAEEWEFLRNAGVCNGCGGNCGNFSSPLNPPSQGDLQKVFCKMQKFLARLISPIFFEASCDKHDFGYWKGGDEARRKECDEKFLEAILRDVEKIPHSPFIKGVYKGIAYLFYFSVRIGGRKYFNFTNK